MPQSVSNTTSAPGFKALLATQFLGALNDNLFKTLISILVVYTGASEEKRTVYVSVAGALLVIPFIFFSSYAGFLADRFSKSLIIRLTKVLELVIMSLAFYFLIVNNVTSLFLLLFFMGLQSCLFSPSKYGILPEILDDSELSKGNGYLQFWTFIAILTGTALSGVLISFSKDSSVLPASVLFTVAAAGLFSSIFVSKTTPSGSTTRFRLNPLTEIICSLKEIIADRGLYLTVVGIAFFWFIGALVQLDIFIYGKEMLKVSERDTSLLLTALAVGIGLGSVAAGKVSEGKVELGLVPLGACGLSLFSIALGFSYFSFLLSLLFLFLLGFSAGIYIVPLSAYIQKNSPPQSRGRYLAAANVISFTGVLLASLALVIIKNGAGLNAAHVFVISGILSAAAAAYIVTILPDIMLRCCNWMLTHTVYRINTAGRGHIPEQGGALIICNHISFVDALLIQAALDRPIRFLIYKPIYEARFVHSVAKVMRAIPIAGREGREQVAAALQTAKAAVQDGELVCVFAEGGISRIGVLLPFKRGFESIMEGVDAPIIPACIDRLWGSSFSFAKYRKVVKKIPQFPYPVTVLFGAPLSPETKAFALRQRVQELLSDAVKMREDKSSLLHLKFIYRARELSSRCAVIDPGGKRKKYMELLTEVLCLFPCFEQRFERGEPVGICLPPSSKAVCINIALVSAGSVPVNLNYAAGADLLHHQIKSCGIKTVIIDDEKRLKTGISGILTLKEIKTMVSPLARVNASLTAYFDSPESIISGMRKAAQNADQPACITFTSGRTGMPKAVLLSHANISSNIESISEVFGFEEDDSMTAIPFYHSFGTVASLWLPVLLGIKAVFAVEPESAASVAETIRCSNASILIGSPTFLAELTEAAGKDDFKSIKRVVTGGDALNGELALTFKEKFALEPLSAYGATELSSAAVMTIPDWKHGAVRQAGQKAGKAGIPLPGVAVRVVDPESGRELLAGQEGLIEVKGPNVMMGYYNDSETTSQVISAEGWYKTDDTGFIDEDGFVEITIPS